MVKISVNAKEVLEKAIAKKDVKNWEYFDYLNLLIKQKVFKYNGKPVTKFVQMRIAEPMDLSECEFFVGSVRYKTIFSKLNMPAEANFLLLEGIKIMFNND